MGIPAVVLDTAELGPGHWLDVARTLLGMRQPAAPADTEAVSAYVDSRGLS